MNIFLLVDFGLFLISSEENLFPRVATFTPSPAGNFSTRCKDIEKTSFLAKPDLAGFKETAGMIWRWAVLAVARGDRAVSKPEVA